MLQKSEVLLLDTTGYWALLGDTVLILDFRFLIWIEAHDASDVMAPLCIARQRVSLA